VISDYEQNHYIAWARELTYAAGFQLRDRYGFCASDETVLYVINSALENGLLEAVTDIGCANALGDIQICRGYDLPTDEEYETGAVTALGPLLDQVREKAASAELRRKPVVS
jgi:hypothetical protein